MSEKLENFTRFIPPIPKQYKISIVPEPPYLIDPRDPSLQTSLLSCRRYDDDYLLFQWKLYYLKKNKGKYNVNDLSTLDLNKLKDYFFKDEHDFKNVFTHVTEKTQDQFETPSASPVLSAPASPVLVAV